MPYFHGRCEDYQMSSPHGVLVKASGRAICDVCLSSVGQAVDYGRPVSSPR